jgi:hypothetical protein
MAMLSPGFHLLPLSFHDQPGNDPAGIFFCVLLIPLPVPGVLPILAFSQGPVGKQLF